jgi:hypothetical protein
LALVVLAAGCGKPRLNESASFDVETGGKLLTVEPTKWEQEIQVKGSATGAQVNVYIYLEKNKAAAQNEIYGKKGGTAVLVKQENTDNIDLRAAIPANEAAVINVMRAVINQKPKVQLTITNK